MSLQYHISVLSPSRFAGDDPKTAQQKLNDNFSLLKQQIQEKSDGHDDAFSSIFGEVLLTKPAVSYSSSSLAITFGPFKVLIGTEISYEGGTFTALANQTNAPVYFCQDGNWSQTEPTDKSYAILGYYTSDDTGILSFSFAEPLVFPRLTIVEGTVEDILVPEEEGYATVYIDHSSEVIFAIPGFIQLTVEPSSDFYVECAYYDGSTLKYGIIDADSDTLTTPPQYAQTNKGFYFTVFRKSGCYYSSNPVCTVTYKRTGLVANA